MALIPLLGNVNQNAEENKILKTLFPNRIQVNRLIDYIRVCESYQKRRRGKKSGRMEEVHTGDTFPRAFCFLESDSRRLQRDSSSTVSTRTGLPQNELKCASTFGSHKTRTNFELSRRLSFFSRCQEKNEFGWLSKLSYKILENTTYL